MSDIPSILLSQDAALNEKRLLLEELRVRREHEIVDRALEYERERLRWEVQQKVHESFTVNGQKFMTYADSIPPGFGFDASGSGMPSVVMTEPNVTDTETGADPPKYRTEQDLSRYRAMARFVTSVHCPGVGIIENLQNYVIGHGFTYNVRTKLGSRPPEGLVVAVQAVVDRFLDDNDWTGELDRELLSRAAVDGEFFVDLLGDRDGVKSGRPRIELVEPHFVTDCGNWEEIQSRHQIPTNFTFGVHSHATKPWMSFGYSIQGSGAWRYGAKSHLVHHRQNSSRNAKRGVSDFFPAWEWLESQARLLRNTAAGAAELSAIAYILKMAGASESRVQSMLSSRADVTFTGPNGQTYYKQWKPPGSVVNAPAGAEYEPGPAGSERGNAFLQVVQGILRQVASRWCMSEGMISSDDSNNNMASSVVAGSRFHRFIMGRQAVMSNCFSTIIWKAIFLAYNAGAFSQYGFSPQRAGGEYQKLESLLELKIECPPADELGKAEQDAIYATRVQAGVMSKTTWRSKVGLDDDVERQNLKRELAESQPPTAGLPEPRAADGMPEIPGKAHLEKRVDPKEELLSRPIQEAFCATGKDGGIDNSCSSRGEGSGASHASSTANTKVHAWAMKKFGNEEKAKAFTSWFGDSKVVDDDGNPLVVYHGTSDEISEFDLDHPNRKDTGWLGTGVYVTTAVDIANSYANLKPGRSYPNVMPLYVKLENPYRAKLADKQRLQIISQSKGGDVGRDAADAWTRQLKAMGHDGVILDFPASLVGKSQASKEIVVFNPSSVKSATGNKGTFNSASPKITESDSSTKYSCLMAMLPAEDAARVLEVAKLVDPQDWADDGREMEPHCTVKYGFLTQDAGEIIPLVRDATAFTLTLGGLSLFPGKEYDVLKLDVSSPALTALNRNLSEALPHADSHHTYVPHVTIGYLKPGTGAKYAGRTCDMSGRVVPVKSLVFSPAEGDRVTIPLRRVASEEAVRGRELGAEAGRKPVEGRRGSLLTWTTGRVVSEDAPSVLAIATATNAAEVLSIRRTCRAFVEQYGDDGLRQILVEAFCPTGDGGGIDNSCSSRDGNGGSALADPVVRGKVDQIKSQIHAAQKQLKDAHARKSKHGIRRGKERLQKLYRSLGKMASQYDDGQPGSGGFDAPLPPHGGYMGKFVAGDGGERATNAIKEPSTKSVGTIADAFRSHELSSAATGKMRTPFGTKESAYAAAMETLDKSEDSYQAVLDMGEGLSEALGAKSLSYEDAKARAKGGSREPVILIAPPKGEKRATEKVEGKYKGDWSRLTDVARATVLVPMQDIPVAIEKLRVEMEERGWKIEPGSVDDRFSKPLKTGYRDVSMLLRAPNGMLAEFQINTHEMWLAKEGDGHRLYEEFRTIDEKEVKTPEEVAKAQQLSKQMSDLYDRAYQEMLRASENTHRGRGQAGESAVSRQRLLWEYP